MASSLLLLYIFMSFKDCLFVCFFFILGPYSDENLKVLATIPYFNFHLFQHLLIFLQFRGPSYVLDLSTKADLQKLYI